MDDWEQRKLKDLADKVSVGIATSSSQYFSNREQGIPFIKNQNIKGNWIDDKNLEYISKEFDKANSTKRIKEGDILTVRTGYPGLSAVVPKELDGAQTFTTLITRLKKGIAIPEFVSIFINSDAGMKQILGMEAGGAQKNVNAGILQNLSIPLPSLVEQKKISKFVIELDKTIALHKDAIQRQQDLKKALLQKLFPVNGERIPTVRFATFKEEWEQRKLGDMVEFFSGLTYSPDNVIKQPGTLVLRSSNVQNGEIVNADNVYVDNEVVNSDNVQVGDIAVVVRNGSRSLIGKHAAIKYPMKDTVIGAFMTGVRSDTPSFTNALLDTQQFETEIAKNLGATINQITTGNFKKMIFNFPEIDERLRIGDFFNQLDNTIALHQRKLEKSKALKSAYLSEMFPAEGERKPKRRFAGFTDDWEQRKLMETNTSFTDGNYGESYPSGNDMSDSRNGVPFLRGSNLKNGKLDNSGANYITLEKHKELTSGHLVYDDIVIAVRGSLGALGYVDIDNVDWNINSQLAIIRTDKSELNGAFVIQFLSSNKGQKELLSRQTGTALKQLPIKQLQDVPVPKPELAEQNKISEFFRQLDDTIALHQHKLEKLKNIKQAYLNEMFV